MFTDRDDDWRRLPSHDAPELDWLLFRQNDVLTVAQAVEALGRGAVQNLLRRKRWQSAARGVVVAHNGPLSREQRIWAAVLSAGGGAFCAGATAATIAGLRGYATGPIELLIPADRRVRRVRGVRVHRTGVMPPEHLIRGNPPCTTMARAVVDAAAWAVSDDDARAIVAAAFQQHRTSYEDINSVLKLMTRSRRRALVAETAGLAAGGAHSLAEVDLVKICRRYGLPRPDQQTRRHDATGRRRYLDAYWSRWHLHVEVDGSFHLDVRTWWADMRRQNDLWIEGDRVLRFPAWVVMREQEAVAAQISAALRAAGWPD